MKRLYLAHSFEKEKILSLDPKQMHYLFHVLRLQDKDEILVFNGKDGEWFAEIKKVNKKNASLQLKKMTRFQNEEDSHILNDVIYCFAPIKQARLEYLLQKAVELKANMIYAIHTQYTQNHFFNKEKILSYLIGAAEQCRALSIPVFKDYSSLLSLLTNWESDRILFFCDEEEQDRYFLPKCLEFKDQKMGILVGPEGGFSSTERDLLRKYDFVKPVTLGKRILRADTAGIFMLSVVNAVKSLQNS